MSDTKFIAIGDIHGCFQSASALLKKLDPWSDRTYVFIGDYIDRGPASSQVVDLLIQFKKDHKCIMLRGNHEQMLLDALDSKEVNLWLQNRDLWLYNGGDTTLRSYDLSISELIDMPHNHLKFYKDTSTYFNTRDYFFVHGGPPPQFTIQQCLIYERLRENFLWERSHIGTKTNKWEKTVIFGHTPDPEPIIAKNMIGIDTGCVYSHRPGLGKLTAVLLPEQEFIFQEYLD